MSADQELDVIARRLREIDPAQTPRDAEPPAYLFALGSRLEREHLAAQKRAKPQRQRARAAWAISLASVAAAATVALSLTLATPPAEASTPLPLVFSAPASEQLVVSDAIARLSDDDGVAAPMRSVRTVSWGIVIEDGTLQGPVVPQFISLDWDADLSGRSVILEGRTASDTDGQVGRVVSTAQVISEQTFAAGEFGVPGPDSPPATDEGVEELLTMFGMPPQPTAGQLVQSMVTVMDYWTLSDAQQAVLLQKIARTGEARSLGSSVDRLGRDVVGLQVPSAVTGSTDTVLISAATGRIVGVETQRTVADDEVPAGTVVEYRMWDSEKDGKR